MKKDKVDKKKKPNKVNLKRLVIIIVVLIIVFIGAYLWIDAQNDKEKNNMDNNTKTLDDGTIENISEQVNQEQTVQGILFSNIKFVQIDHQITFTADVKNTTDKKTEGIPIRLEFVYDEIDDQGQNFSSTIMAMVAPLEAGASTTVLAQSEVFDHIIQADSLKIIPVNDNEE